MGNEVYADGMEIACKAGAGKAICAFPDVCFTPPQTPATPPGVPIPYPNTGMASDTTDGSKKVKVSGKEVMLKNKSSFKKSSGNEAGSAPKKGVVTSKNTGKVFFNMWSMDVKIEGENVVRHFDLTTHNHGSTPGNTPPWPYIDMMALSVSASEACKKEKEREEEACKNLVVRRDTKAGKNTGAILKGETKTKICEDQSEEGEKCRQAQKCRLTPQKEGCCPNSGQEAHHVVEAHGFYQEGERDNLHAKPLSEFAKPSPGYQPGEAPCVCVQGSRGEAEHGAFHAMVGKKENKAMRGAEKTGGDASKAWTYKEAKKAGIAAHRKIFLDSKCGEKCLEAQLDAYHNRVGANDNTPVRTEKPPLKEWQKKGDDAVLKTMQKHFKSDNGLAGVP